MISAPAPMTGGVSAPPVEATASIAAARVRPEPTLSISGMVTCPPIITFATLLPETIPNSADEMTEMQAGPPRMPPASRIDILSKKTSPPISASAWPKATKRQIQRSATCVGSLKSPGSVMMSAPTTRRSDGVVPKSQLSGTTRPASA